MDESQIENENIECIKAKPKWLPGIAVFLHFKEFIYIQQSCYLLELKFCSFGSMKPNFKIDKLGKARSEEIGTLREVEEMVKRASQS